MPGRANGMVAGTNQAPMATLTHTIDYLLSAIYVLGIEPTMVSKIVELARLMASGMTQLG